MKRNGQAILEYVIMLTAIIAAFAFAVAKITEAPTTGKEKGLRKVLSDTATKMENVTGNLSKDFFNQ